jgi:hypothetical protein
MCGKVGFLEIVDGVRSGCILLRMGVRGGFCEDESIRSV